MKSQDSETSDRQKLHGLKSLAAKERAQKPSSDRSKKSQQKADRLPQETSSSVVFRPIALDERPILPLEDALRKGKTIAFYLPSGEERELALYMLARRLEKLRKKGISFPEPNYEFVIAEESPGWNGDLDAQNRVIIHCAGAARFG